MPTATPAPAVTLAVATPVIIASPTPLPTPVIHIIEPGDTLIALAVKYGVSVEALQAANGNIQPEALSIGAPLVIPLSSDAPIVRAANLPTPVPIPVGAPVCYPLATGALYCLAEVHNTGDVALENVSARITLAGADGLPLAEALAPAALDVIRPGESAPLAALFPSAPGGVAAVGAALVSALPLDDLAARYILLEIPTHTGEAIGSAWTVTGQIRNPSASDAAAVRLVLTLYDGADAVLGFRQTPLEGGLAAGAARDFTTTATALSGAAARYTIAAEGRP
jgi:LysM repeat protein